MRQHIKYYFSRNLIEYIKAFAIFIIGIVVAIITINNSNEIQKKELKSYVDEKISVVKNSEYSNQGEVFVDSLKNNFKYFIFLIFLSSTIIGIPVAYYLIAKKGFSIGYTIAAIYATQNVKTGIIFICNSLVIHNIMYMISMFIVLVAGNDFSKNLIGKENNIKFEIVRYIIFSVIALAIVITSSFFEAYISTNFLFLLKKYL